MCESGRNEMQASVELKLKSAARVVLVGGNVAMRQRHALGLARGPGGVDQRGQVLRAPRTRTSASKTGSRSLPRASAPASTSLKAIAPSGGAAESMITIRSNCVCARTAFSLSNCWRVETTAMRQPASLHQRGHLLAGQRGIDGHIDRADGQRGKVRDCPLPAVLADQRNAVALLRSPAQETPPPVRGRADKSGRRKSAAIAQTRPARARRAGWLPRQRGETGH